MFRRHLYYDGSGDVLQVENVFNLQVLGEDKDTQLNLTWRTLDEKKNEEDYCKGCGTFELREMIGVLVEKLVGEKRVEVVVQKKPIVVVEEKKKEVLYWVNRNGEFGWNKSGDEKKDSKYVGEIEERVPSGQGTFTFLSGSKYFREWKDGMRLNGTQYDKNGKILYKLVNGKRTKQ